MNSGDEVKRRYRAPRRAAAAAATREGIVRAARELFERRGWAGTTVRAVAAESGVSQKTVEALFGTKAALLEAAVDQAIRGDLEPVGMPRRESVRRMEAAPDAAAMVGLHAAHVARINARSAGLAWAIEHAAASDPVVADLWGRMHENRRYAVRWAATTLLAKPGRRQDLRRRDVEATFWVAIDWGTYRTLTRYARLGPRGFEAWLRAYYRAAFLES